MMGYHSVFVVLMTMMSLLTAHPHSNIRELRDEPENVVSKIEGAAGEMEENVGMGIQEVHDEEDAIEDAVDDMQKVAEVAEAEEEIEEAEEEVEEAEKEVEDAEEEVEEAAEEVEDAEEEVEKAEEVAEEAKEDVEEAEEEVEEAEEAVEEAEGEVEKTGAAESLEETGYEKVMEEEIEEAAEVIEESEDETEEGEEVNLISGVDSSGSGKQAVSGSKDQPKAGESGLLECKEEGEDCMGIPRCCRDLVCAWAGGLWFKKGQCVKCVGQNGACHRDGQCCSGLQCDKEHPVHVNGICTIHRQGGADCFENSQCTGWCERKLFHIWGKCINWS